MIVQMSVSDREFATLAERVETLVRDLRKVESTVTDVDSKVDGIITTLAKVEGGWKVLIAIGGIAGAVGGLVIGLVIKAWPFLLGTLPKV